LHGEETSTLGGCVPGTLDDAAGDKRPSLAERYPSHADYVAKVTAAANQLVKQRLLLQQDADMIIKQANDAAVP
jgi:hypothetical protein